jgi:large subunit ribosomal protein L6
MSRIGIQPVKIEEGVEVSVAGQIVTIKGSLGELKIDLPEKLKAEVKEGEVLVTRSAEDKQTRSSHGTFRSHIANAVFGVKEGFKKELELVGVGYRAFAQGNDLQLTLGWNHPIDIKTPEGLKIEVPSETQVIISGFDKQLVGEHAARIREIRKPEPYKGKGIRYKDERVRRKSSKSGLGA